jgi:4-carboxymuconolactone decarboxylase
MIGKNSMCFSIIAIFILFGSYAMGADNNHPLGSRIEPPKTESMTQGQKDAQLKAVQGTTGQVKGPTLIYLNDPEVSAIYKPYSQFMADIPFDKRHRELTILVVARAWDSQYEWWAHESSARSAGISDAVIEAIRANKTPVFDKPDEKIIYDYAHEMVTLHKVSDQTYKKAWDLLDTSMLIKLTMLIGHYCGVAVTLNAHQVALPAGEKIPLPVK